jgi:hypothetical protein
LFGLTGRGNEPFYEEQTSHMQISDGACKTELANSPNLPTTMYRTTEYANFAEFGQVARKLA